MSMANMQAAAAQYLSKYGHQSIACNYYVLTKLGIDRIHCYLKIDEYIILCVPFQLGFKRALFLASLSRQELNFFRRYINSSVGLSIGFAPNRKQAPIQFFIRCNLVNLGQMKGRENVGILVVDYKSTPHDMVILLGDFLENQLRLRAGYDEYGNSIIKMTANTTKMLGYNMYATITEPNNREKRIQLFSLSTKTIEHLEAVTSRERPPGTQVHYHLFFKKYRIFIPGTVKSVVRPPQGGIIKTSANLVFSPELVEIIGDYWYTIRRELNETDVSANEHEFSRISRNLR
jgi:hypothetical protein